MDIPWCGCAERQLSEMGRLTCLKCGAYVQCDFCRSGAQPAASFPLGILIVAGKVVCSDHAWLAARLEKPSMEQPN